MTRKNLFLSSAALFASMFTASIFALDAPKDATAAAADAASTITDAAADVTAAAGDTAADASAGDFATLDADGDGAISVSEAEGNPSLMETWSQVDANQDGQLDASEFSAFEAGSAAE